jgi:hypothetical protein
MPTKRWATEGAVIGDILYVIGGAGSSGAGSANEAHPFGAYASTTEITADNPDPSIQNQSFSINFTVSSTEGIPSGVVTVTVDNDSATCSDNLVNGTGSCKIVLSSAGLYTLTASYGGDEFFSPSSDVEDHTVIHGLYVPFIVK